MQTEDDDIQLDVEKIEGASTLVINLRDKDTGIEVATTVTVAGNYQSSRRQLGRAFADALDRLWPLEASDDGAKEGSGP